MGAAETALADLVANRDRVWSARAGQLADAAIADTLAVGLVGLSEPQVGIARATLLTSAQPDAVPTWSPAEQYSVPDAAFLLGVACHSLDWDDYMHPMHGHCSAVLLPVAWLLTEQRDGSGADLTDAYLTGYQANYLVSQALGHAHYRHGWHATSTVGTIGAAAAAARLLGLDQQQAGHALAIAASSAGGIRANFGTSTKALHAGFAARNGVQAAQLARAGAEGSADWLLGEHGMQPAFSGDRAGDDAARAILAATEGSHGIETEWGLVQKPYCCCGSCHAAVEALIAVVERHDLAGNEIDRGLTRRPDCAGDHAGLTAARPVLGPVQPDLGDGRRRHRQGRRARSVLDGRARSRRGASVARAGSRARRPDHQR